MESEKEPRTRSERSTEGHTYEVVEIYTDTQGNTWWAFKDPLKMPPGRTIAAELASEWVHLNVTPKDQKAFYAKMREHANAGNIVDLFKVLALMEERTDWAMDGKALMEFAKVYFLVNDEPIDGNTEHHDATKETAWSHDPTCRGFFLRQAFVRTKGFSEFSEADILACLRAQEVLAMKTMLEPPKENAPGTGKPLSRKSFMARGKTSTPKPSSSVGKSPAK